MSLPVPADLASVAYLADRYFGGEFWLTDHYLNGDWVPFKAYKDAKADAKRAARHGADMLAIIRDQRAHIERLEEQLAPHLVQALPDQGELL